MCPLYPFHMLLLYAAVLFSAWTITGAALVKALSLRPRLAVNGSAVPQVALTEGEEVDVAFLLEGLPPDYSGTLLLQVVTPDDIEHAFVSPHSFRVDQDTTTLDQPPHFPIPSGDNNDTGSTGGRYLTGEFTARGEFLGFSKLKFVLSDGGNDSELVETQVPIKVERGPHVLDKIFVHVVVLLVVMVYINMGCTIDLDTIKLTIRRPVAPLIGLLSQYIFMPLCSYGLGYLLLGSSPALWLGLFVTGCSPGGGGSNMWTYLLGGSLDLSVTMTFVSTITAFVAMPLWVWALAPTIFVGGEFDSLLMLPSGGEFDSLLMLPSGGEFDSLLMIPSGGDGNYVTKNHKFFKWHVTYYFYYFNVAVCGFSLPLLGFMAGAAAAVATRREAAEVIAISVETGLQNTGLAIGLLKISLSSFSPLGDIAMVVPIAVATLTPVPLFAAYFVTLCRKRRLGKGYDTHVELGSESSTPTS
ncbi:P3 protein [Hyalella azteca]|uniref:P3 protein n=1 Tax=Hyalella azteca TaxID=294128 RepID=A0A8B7NTS7_HYAAZ|nr:P3 protein [Hyalella azteca]